MANEKNQKSQLMTLAEFIKSLSSENNTIDTSKVTPGLREAYNTYLRMQKALRSTTIELTEKDGKYSK